ncbi:MAG: hypothetical protein HKO13_06225 [Sphingomonas sp.]|nr:hypothetical protein [Sphingomonas sp.]RZV52053.1 MAG: hypothetical protein EX258_02755 [Sphingomonadaceae bacterium]
MRVLMILPVFAMIACSVDNESPGGNEITIGYDAEEAANIADDVGAIVEDGVSDVRQELAEEANEAEAEMAAETDPAQAEVETEVEGHAN